jgi:hypothetical protein
MKRETFIKKWAEPLNTYNLQAAMEAYRTRFGREYTVLFEHCLAYVDRLIHDTRYDSCLLKTNSVNLALLENDNLYIFLPEMNHAEFASLYRDANSSEIKLSIRDVSKEYLNVNNFYLLKQYHYSIFSRSFEEIILSTHKLSKIVGQEYSALRNIVNKIEKGGLAQYAPLQPGDYSELKELVDAWLATQGNKYSSNRKEVDLRYLKFFLENNGENFISRKLYFQDALCGVALIEIVRPGFGVYIMNKCLNGVLIQGKTYGISGLSKYLYYKTCCELEKKGILFVNVGSLGKEEGVRKSKEELRPLDVRLESYQINYETL